MLASGNNAYNKKFKSIRIFMIINTYYIILYNDYILLLYKPSAAGSRVAHPAGSTCDYGSALDPLQGSLVPDRRMYGSIRLPLWAQTTKKTGTHMRVVLAV